VTVGGIPWTTKIETSSTGTIAEISTAASNTAAETTVGEVICSARSLVKRFMPWIMGQDIAAVARAGSEYDAATLFYQPNGNCLASLDSTSIPERNYQDWVNYFQNCFAFRRGGMRMKCAAHDIGSLVKEGDPASLYNAASQNKYIRLFAYNETPYFESGLSPSSDVVQTLYDSLPAYFSASMPIYNFLEGIISIDHPFYSRAHCLLNELQRENTDPLSFNPVVVDEFLTPKNFYAINSIVAAPSPRIVQLDLYRAGRDDFELGFWIGVPYLEYLSANSPPPYQNTQETSESHHLTQKQRVISTSAPEITKTSRLMPTPGRRYHNAVGETLHTLLPGMCISGATT